MFGPWTVLIMCQDDTLPPENVFFFFFLLLASITHNKFIHTYVIFLGVVDHVYAIGQNRKYRSFGSYIYICCFGPLTVFNHVPGKQPTHHKCL